MKDVSFYLFLLIFGGAACCYLDEFRKGLVDEDQRYEESKYLLSKWRDVSDKKTALCCHNHQDNENEPEANPYSTSQVLIVVGLTELSRKTRNAYYIFRDRKTGE